MQAKKNSTENASQLMRSVLFVPANNPRHIEKAVSSKADALVLDFEDAVPEDEKAHAREIVGGYLARGAFRGRTIFVRTNPSDSAHFMADVDAVVHPDVAGYMPPKVSAREELSAWDELLTRKENEAGIPAGHFKLAPLIESPAAVLHLPRLIEGAKRLVAIAFGGSDFLNDLEGNESAAPEVLDTPRTLIALAARSVGISPLDTPFFDLNDPDGFARKKREAYGLGFAGTLLIHPSQIESANRCFLPSDEEVRKARRIVDAVDESRKTGSSYVTLDGIAIGTPVQKRARKIIAYMALVDAD